MSIPFYFAMNEDEEKKYKAPFKAQLGFGFQLGGNPVVPSRVIPRAPMVINDMVLPAGVGQTNRLAEYGSVGCILDFERELLPIHIEILKQMEVFLPKDAFIAIPQALVPYSSRGIVLLCPDRPVNSWEGFCQAQARGYKRWFWEAVPWEQSRAFPFRGVSQGSLPGGTCRYETHSGTIHYYDTWDTIRQKLAIAEQWGCQGAIGLAMELWPLKEQNPEG